MAQASVAAVSGTTQDLVHLALQAYELRHKVIAHNIANVDSQGFQPLRLNFEEQLGPLQQAVQSHASAAEIARLAAQVHPRIEPEAAPAGALAEPGEKLDDQLVALTQNTLDYEALLTVVARYGALNRIAITGS